MKQSLSKLVAYVQAGITVYAGLFIATIAHAQITDLRAVEYAPVDYHVAGIPLSSIFTGLRFIGALWACIGVAYILWGGVEYMLSHGNEHHKHDAQLKIADGFMILLMFAIAWGITKIVAHYIFA